VRDREGTTTCSLRTRRQPRQPLASPTPTPPISLSLLSLPVVYGVLRTLPLLWFLSSAAAPSTPTPPPGREGGWEHTKPNSKPQTISDPMWMLERYRAHTRPLHPLAGSTACSRSIQTTSTRTTPGEKKRGYGSWARGHCPLPWVFLSNCPSGLRCPLVCLACSKNEL
jgi:hypothetical protein